jgi:hypothetical protein
MSDLLPKLAAFVFCLIVCAVGLYFQRRERKQEEWAERQKLEGQQRQWRNQSVHTKIGPLSAAEAMQPPDNPESSLANLRERKRSEGYLQ